MIDHKISATSALAYALWGIGLALIGASFALPLQLAAVGLFLAGTGGVLTIRGFFCAQQRREQNAFELGRDYAEHRRDGVRSLR